MLQHRHAGSGGFVRPGRIVFDATLSAAVESALATGVDQSSNPFFGDANVDDVTSGTAVPAYVALSLLEEAIGETCRQGMIHITPAFWRRPGGNRSTWLPPATWGRCCRSTAPLLCRHGLPEHRHPVSGDPGHTEDWAFATGPPRVYYGAVRIDKLCGGVEVDTNIITFRAERYVFALWDATLQAAALMDWAT